MQLYHTRILLQQPLIFFTLTYFSFSLPQQDECHVLLAVEPPNNQDGGEKVTYLTIFTVILLGCNSAGLSNVVRYNGVFVIAGCHCI